MKILTHSEAERLKGFLSAFHPPPAPPDREQLLPSGLVLVRSTDIFGYPTYTLHER